MFQNLLHNAAKFTPPGGRITLHFECEGEEVRVSIHDTGIGISTQNQARVFEIFTRVNPDDAMKTSGLGIGLALARQLVERQHGRLELRSEGAGKGSEFIVSLPLSKASTATTSSMETASAAAAAHDARRVLVVDDNEDAADSLAMLLQIDGSTVSVAGTGAAAIEAFEIFAPEIVILDIGLPDIDGYEVARRMRTHERGSDAFLIALTGWGQEQDKKLAAEAGFDEHLTKPVDLEVLRTLMDAKTSTSRGRVTGR